MSGRHQKLAFISLIFIAFIMSLFLPEFLKVVIQASGHMSQAQNVGEYITGISWAIAIGIILLFLPIQDEDRRILVWLWFFRSIVVLGFMVFYERKYNLDAYLYFRDGLAGDFYTSWLEFHGTSSVTAFVWILNQYLPTQNSYHAIKVIFSFIGLMGSYFFYLAYKVRFGANPSALWILGLTPSLLFWSSILGKDPIVFMGLGLMTYGIMCSAQTLNIKAFSLIVAGGFIVSLIRFWLVPIYLLPALVSIVPFPQTKSTSRWLMRVLFVGVTYFAVGFFINRVDFTSLSDAYERVNFASRAWSSGGSSLNVPEFKNWADMVSFAPLAAFTALFRPLPGELNHIFGVFAGLENIILLFFTVRFFLAEKSKAYLTSTGIYLLTTVFLWSFIYGFFSFQNLGTAVRFKIQILPLLIIFLLQRPSDKNEKLVEK